MLSLTSPQQRHDLTLVISDLSGGGAQRVLTMLANRWAVKGCQVAVITFAGPEKDYFRLDSRIKRFIAGDVGDGGSTLRALIANIRRVWALRQALRQTAAPVVVAFIGATNILTILASVGLGICVVISERNDPKRQSLGRSWDMMRRWLYRFADIVTANSHGALAVLSDFVPAHKLSYVANPLWRPDSVPPRTSNPVILNVGRLVPQKAQDVLIDAFAEIAAEVPGWMLVIVGEGPEEALLRRRVADRSIVDRVLICGQTNPWPEYARASVFALPSRFEGTPNALLEAMSMGLPSVVSDASQGPLDYVQHEENGLVVPSDDVGSLASALKRLIIDGRLRKRIGEAASHCVADCDIELVVARWDALLRLDYAERVVAEAAVGAATN